MSNLLLALSIAVAVALVVVSVATMIETRRRFYRDFIDRRKANR